MGCHYRVYTRNGVQYVVTDIPSNVPSGATVLASGGALNSNSVGGIGSGAYVYYGPLTDRDTGKVYAEASGPIPTIVVDTNGWSEYAIANASWSGLTGPNSGLDSYSLGGGNGSPGQSIQYNGRYGPPLGTPGSNSGNINLIYLPKGIESADTQFLVGMDLLRQILQQEFPGYNVQVKTFGWPDQANTFANNNPYDFNFAIAHGEMTQLDQYMGGVIIHGTTYAGSVIDNNPNYDQAFHCGQGPNGTSITLSTVYSNISKDVRSFLQPFF